MALRGGIITRRPLCFADDGRVFFAPCGKDVRVYSAESGEHIGTLSGHTATVTSVALDPASSSQVYTSSQDGTLRLWDVAAGECLRTFAIGQPIERMVVSREAAMAYLSLTHRLGAGKLLGFRLSDSVPLSSAVRPRGPLRAMAASPSGRFLAAPDKFSLWVWGAGEDGERRPVNFHHVRQYTCCAFDPTDTILAAGDVSGRIILWHNFQKALTTAVTGVTGGVTGSNSAGSGGAVPAATTLHWHAHPVGALAFSPDGASLLSGGAEAVLVQWQLATGKRNYLPRLGGPLVGILPCASDPAKYCVAQADNTVRMVNLATMRVEATVHGLRPAPPPAPPGRAAGAAPGGGGAAALQPGTGYLVVPGPNALLQFFDAARERHAARLQVAPRNPVSLTGPAAGAAGAEAAAAAGGAAPVEPQVVALAFSPGGSTLVTVDIAPGTGPAAAPLQSLKFWDAASSGAQAGAAAPYSLNTRADGAHAGTITALAFHPTEHVAATTSEDGEFRVWARAVPAKAAAAAARAPPGRWRCRSVGGYKRAPLCAAAFSLDGSLLAVGAGATATLWDPSANALVAALPSPPPSTDTAAAAANGSPAGGSGGGSSAGGPRLTRLAFSHHSPHLAGLLTWPAGSPREGDDTLVVWDLLTLAVAWSAAVPNAAALAADPAHPLFAVALNYSVSKQQGGGQQQQAAGGEQTEQQQHATRAAAAPAADGGGSSSADNAKAARAARRAARRGCVLLFSPTSPTPVLASALPAGAAISSLLSVPPRTPLGAAAAAAGGPADASPLLALTEDRSYTIVARPGARGAAAAGSAAATPGAAAAAVDGSSGGAKRSVLEELFGAAAAPAAAGVGGSSLADGHDARSTAKRVAALFDAPSHALPAPALLAPTLLELLVSGDGSGL